MSSTNEVTTKHKVLKEGLTHNRKACQIGDTIEVTEQQRQALVERKFIADNAAPKQTATAETK